MIDLKKYGIIEENKSFFEESLYCTALIYGICNNRLTEFLKSYELTPSKLNILVAVRFHGGQQGISQVDLSHHLIVTPSNMTKMLDKLEKDGLVTRQSLPGDRRVNIIKVTSKAEQFLDELWLGYLQVMETFMDGLSSEDKEQTALYLKKWLRALLSGL